MEDYKHPELIHSSGRKMELDIYIKSLKLAVEYQGEQHYRPIDLWAPNFPQQQIIDEEKKRVCKEVNNNFSKLLLIAYQHFNSMTSH